MTKLLLSNLLFLMMLPYTVKAEDTTGSSPLDMVIVLDASASMHTNIPENLQSTAAKALIDKAQLEDRVGVVSFAAQSELVSPLIALISPQDKESLRVVVDSIALTGRFTNFNAGMERALYELKKNGREQAHSVVILLTDGKLDPPPGIGTKRELLNSIRGSLLPDYEASGISIYGIIFSESADFQLIQELAFKTNGEYYRVFTEAQLQASIESIYGRLKETERRVKEWETKRHGDKETRGFFSTSSRLKKSPPFRVTPSILRILAIGLLVVAIIFAFTRQYVRRFLITKSRGERPRLKAGGQAFAPTKELEAARGAKNQLDAEVDTLTKKMELLEMLGVGVSPKTEKRKSAEPEVTMEDLEKLASIKKEK